MTQTWALLVDAYRELNSKKLFWITLILSAIVVLACGMLGINEKGITFLHWQFDAPMFTTALMTPAEFYKMIFASMAIPFWLTWVAAILALISTGSMFPDFIASGSIELTLSKPIGRIRLFLTKYATGLLFAGLQVMVFTLAAFLVIGVRGDAWEWSLFLAVPIVVIFFSYLFSICVLLGIVTRSAIASILLTLLIWFAISMLGTADSALLMFKTQGELQSQDAQKSIARVESVLNGYRTELAEVEDGASELSAEDREAKVASLTGRIANAERSIEDRNEEAEEGLRMAEQIEPWHRGVVAARTVLPKTADTIGLLSRWLVDLANLPGMRAAEDATVEGAMNARQNDVRVNRAVQEKLNDRPVWWVLGTSLAFEAVVLAIGAFIFSRRDF